MSFTLRSQIPFELIFAYILVGVKLIPFTEKTVLSLLFCIVIYITYQVSKYIGICFWIVYCSPLVYISVLTSHCFKNCSLIMSSYLVQRLPTWFLFQKYLGYDCLFVFPYKFYNQLIKFQKTIFQDFDWDCIEYLDQFGRNVVFIILSLPVYAHIPSLHLVWSSLMYLNNILWFCRKA